MEFRETLLAAQRNQQQKSSESSYYKAKFDPPKKEQRQKDRLSANIQKFLAKKDEEEKQKKLEAQRKRDELISMRDPKALRKIQKTLKVIKSANKSVLQDAVDHDNTAVTLAGADQPDQDDYGYESQEAAALYQKMMQKYSKIPDEPKFPVANKSVKRDINGTIERVKHALQHEDDPVPHKRKRRSDAGGVHGDRDLSPPTKYEPEKEKKKDEKPEKPKIRKPMPPPMDFNQLLKLAEQKKSEPIIVADKKPKVETSAEPERLMTKRQRREYEEEMARRQRRQERLDAEKGGKKIPKDDRPAERERKPEPAGFGRIPKIGEKLNGRHDSPKAHDKDRDRYERDRDRDKYERDRDRDKYERDRDRDKYERDRDRDRYEGDRDRDKYERDRDRDKYDRERIEKMQREKERARDREKDVSEKAEREKERMDREKLERLKAERDKLDREIDRERLERLKAERDRIDREMERLARDKLDKPKPKLEPKTSDKSRLPVDRSKLGSRDPVRQDVKKPIDLKSQNTYRIDKNDDRRVLNKSDGKVVNGHSSQSKPVPKQLPQKAPLGKKLDGSPKLNGQARPENGKRPPEKPGLGKRPEDKKPVSQAGTSKPVVNFDFDKHVGAFKNKARQYPPGDVKRKQQAAKAKRRLDSDEEYDSEMDDFIDDGDEEMDYSRHIKEIFGYDKSKYRYMDDDDDPNMESSFVQQQREEYISKKHGIMEDLEDMRLEAMMKSKSKGKKKRKISDD